MTTYELNRSQLNFLKWCLYYNTDEINNLNDDEITIINKCHYPNEIPDTLVHKEFSGICFVPEDF